MHPKALVNIHILDNHKFINGYLYNFSRPEDPFDSIRAECIIRNHPADNNTLELAEMAVAGIATGLSFIVIDNSSVTSG